MYGDLETPTAGSEMDEARERAKELIGDMIETFTRDPREIANYLSFVSKFRHYSPRNTLLIKAQNPGADFCLPKAEWEKAGYNIKEGQNGMFLFVYSPYKLIIDNATGEVTPYKEASRELLDAVSRGEARVKQATGYRVGETYDIGQTDFPPDEYPEILGVGYDSETRARVYDALKGFLADDLSCDVIDTNEYDNPISSISLRGMFLRVENIICINPVLRDSERLSTLAHEAGHAICHGESGSELWRRKSKAQKEFEADATGIMLCSKLGVGIEDTRLAHLKNAFSEMKDEFDRRGERHRRYRFDKELDKVFKGVFAEFEAVSERLDSYMQERGIETSKDPVSRLREFVHARDEALEGTGPDIAARDEIEPCL